MDAPDPGVVPDVVGMVFTVARELAAASEIALASPDLDGEPIGTVAWPGVFVVTAQDPAAGARLPRWGGLRVWVRKQNGGSANEPAIPPPVPPQHPRFGIAEEDVPAAGAPDISEHGADDPHRRRAVEPEPPR